MSEEFFIGWSTALAPRLRHFLPRAALGLLLLLSAAGFGLGAAAVDPAGEDFALAPGEAPPVDVAPPLRGVIMPGPAPLLYLPPDAAHPAGHAVLLSGDGKRGPGTETAALAGKPVEARGYMLRRGALDMLVLDATPAVMPGVAPRLPAVEKLGRWRISGEICDGKCGAGAMQPGTGLAHRACATLCLDGDIPAVFVATGPVAGREFLLLADRNGNAPFPALRDQVGRLVTLEGAVERRGDMLVLRAEAP